MWSTVVNTSALLLHLNPNVQGRIMNLDTKIVIARIDDALFVGSTLAQPAEPATTVTYDVEADCTNANPSGVWSYHAAINPLQALVERAPRDSLMLPTNGTGPGFGNADQGRVTCSPFTAFSAFTQGTYVRFTNPASANLSVFFELKPVHS